MNENDNVIQSPKVPYDTTFKDVIRRKRSSSDKSLKYINKILDDMGFTRYHVLLFVTNSLFLFAEGMQEIIHIILLSMINDEHNLTSYHLAFMNSIEYLGYSIATLLINQITKIISRKSAILIFVITSLVVTGLSLTSFNFILAAINRFILGVCFGVLDVLIYLNLFESLPTKIRGFVSMLILLFFPLGEFVLSVICYFKLTEGELHINYRILLLTPFIISCIICLLAIFALESPRYLMFGKNEFQRGVENISKIAKFNRNSMYMKDKFNENLEVEMTQKIGEEDNDRNNLEDAEGNLVSFGGLILDEGREKNDLNVLSSGFPTESSGTFSELFNKIYARDTVIFWIIGGFAGFVFNAIHFMLPATAPKIDKMTFLDLVFFECMEIPSNFFAALLVEHKDLGRLVIIKFGFIFSFLISLVNLYLGESNLVFDCLLKFWMTIPLNVLFVYCSEIYSSEIRTLGLSMINFFRKIVALFAPFIMSWVLIKYGEFATHYYYSPALFVCGFCAFFFTKETRGVALDEVQGNK